MAALPRRRIQFHSLLDNPATGGVLLLVVALIAMVVANTPASDIYFQTLDQTILGLSVLHWINDGLMAVFFLVIGIEVKRELLTGQLSSWPRRALPGLAALGGMVAPALVYAAVNIGSVDTGRGWAIPAATDIAFALGVLSLLGRRVPASLLVFLTALAILDDLGAILIIALFYATSVDIVALGAALLIVAILCGLNRLGYRTLTPYLVLGALLWVFVLRSGFHATLAGVILAFTIPAGEQPEADQRAASPSRQLERVLHPWVAFAILPLFGFANAGVSLFGTTPTTMLSPVPLGVALGLALGKQGGVFGFAWLAIRSGVAELPAHATWRQLYGVSLLCGIGFTMSLFIALLAFPASEFLQSEAKIGILAGSVLAGVAGWLVLRFAPRSKDDSRRHQTET